MARIGNALRGLSLTGQPASTLLGWLNRVVCADECPGTGRLGGGLRVRSGSPGAALGPGRASAAGARLRWRGAAAAPGRSACCSAARRTRSTALAYEQLAAGDVLFCYTDGLIERRGRDFDEGLAGLLAAAAGCQRETADDAVIALFDRLEPPAADDDVCVLAVRVS